MGEAIVNMARAQQTIEKNIDLNKMRRFSLEYQESLRAMQATERNVNRYMEQIQPAVNSIQQVSGILQAYNDNLSSVYNILTEWREKIRLAVEDQIELEMPARYESVDPHPTAKLVAEQWAEQFITDLEETDDEYFENVVERMKDGLDDFRNEPERPYAAIHIFITVQDSLLWCLCSQDEDISQNGTNDSGLPKYKTSDKQTALERNYRAYFGVESDDVSNFSQYKWDCFWAHRHAIMHGDVNATYDMNIATTALLFFALTANSVLEIIREKVENDEEFSIIEDARIEQALTSLPAENQNDPHEAFNFMFD